ncbi:MAG: tetratricopeptide repeat protein, partial [Pseudomonadota bacterium]
MGEDLGLSMSQVVRAEVFAEAGALWLILGEPHFAHTAFLNAQRLDAALVQPTLLARAKAALGHFSDARALLNRHLTTVPDDQEARFLRAQILRELDAFDEAAQDLATLGDAPQVQIERALLAADQGDLHTASDLLLDVIAAAPDSRAAQDAQAELQRLAQ